MMPPDCDGGRGDSAERSGYPRDARANRAGGFFPQVSPGFRQEVPGSTGDLYSWEGLSWWTHSVS